MSTPPRAQLLQSSRMELSMLQPPPCRCPQPRPALGPAGNKLQVPVAQSCAPGQSPPVPGESGFVPTQVMFQMAERVVNVTSWALEALPVGHQQAEDRPR